MRSHRIRGRSNIAICVAAALIAIAPASIVRAADGDDFAQIGALSDATAQPLQLGVGQSVIRDLPEEAGEIYVGDPTVANAIVRTAKRRKSSATSLRDATAFTAFAGLRFRSAR